ncbi:hypothetical protein [Roseofilum casamattae]|uniref:Uncharacterized protein n=1 Tax=Roseofilum casamattae BLCC-M143 TaxID=3022442 RepID=A0ABT7BVE0_9CYAN|nr:hypothetical protein [Roseofilum casamattae]MDJ1183065.1 hypothetical protein [Roseofilum casamattae BLCC-M143]
MQTGTARTISLSQLEEKFQLRYVKDPAVFLEWQSNLPELSQMAGQTLPPDFLISSMRLP